MANAKSGKKTKPTVTGAAPPGAFKPRPQKRIVAAVCAALVVVCAAIYGQTLSHGFVNYDDPLYVTDNPNVQAGLSLQSIGWAFVTDRAMYLHPLTWMSHMLDCSLYGMHPWGHHLTNLLFHAAASVLLFLALRLLTGALWPSAAVAALFAVHPLHVESVAWIAERKDVLSALFWMLALGAYGLYVRRRGAARYAAVTAAFVLGLMSKPMVVTLPFVLLLLDWWPLDQVNATEPFGVMARKTARLAAEKIPLFLIMALSCLSTFVMQARGHNIDIVGKVSLAARCANVTVVYVLYLAKTVWPSGLAVSYPYPDARPVWQVAGAALTLAAITLFCLSQARHRPYFIVGWLWYLGTLAPVSGLVRVGDYSHADRYTYIPSIGVFVMVVWGVADLAAAWRVPKRAVAVASGAALVALTVCAVVQAGYWRDSKTLFSHAIAVGQESCTAFNNLGLVAKDEKRYDDVQTCLTKALALEPDRVDVLTNLGLLALDQKRYDDANAYLTKALGLRPDHVNAVHDAGLVALAQRRYDDAKVHLTKAAGLNPNDAKILNNLGVCLINLKEYEEAERNIRKALELDPQFTNAANNMGIALSKLGRKEEADVYMKRAEELKQSRKVGNNQ